MFHKTLNQAPEAQGGDGEITGKLEIDMSEIKVGDRVKIADYVDQDKYNMTCGWATTMKSFLGTEGIVLEVNSEMGWAIVEFKEDGRLQWTWHLDDLTVVPVASIGHKHAALMMEYAKDAQTHERPWELWESRFDSDSKWEAMIINPTWSLVYEYRRKPSKKTIMVNGVEVPAPEKENLSVGVEYWTAEPSQYNKTIGPITWNDDDHDRLWLSRGVVYLNKEDAVARAEAMLITEEVDC